jgi:asparagine synthase (glutamine-hydrolysing)
MCGIAGYFGFEKDDALLGRMNDAQAHRGPDGEGIFSEGVVGLGHRRLAIIDRAHGQEPLFSPDKNLVITYNGEVYNYKELREELVKKGRTFATESDTEVIVQAYAEWGVQAFDKFNGMFAFALYDRKAKKLVLARDHFGIKPLYFANIGDAKKPKLLFASEAKALLASGQVKPKANDKVIYRYLRYRIHDESTETFFDGIYTLQPGECMTLTEEGGMQIQPYTQLQQELAKLAHEQRPYSDAETAHYRQAFTDAIRMRLASEVPVGTCLSGGLDSSAVTLAINRLFYKHDEAAGSVGAVQNTFSAVFPGSINDEEKYVDAVIDVCKGDVAVYKVFPNADEFKTDLADFVRTQEEPTISTAQYAQYKVMQEAAKHVTVLLDGQGADEMLTGYYPYFLVYLRQLKRQGRWFKLASEIIRSSDILFRAIRFRLLDALQFKRAVSVQQLLRDDFRAAYKTESYSSTPDDLRTRFIEDIFHHSLPSLLRYEDRNSMRFSLEGRVPFLDKEVTKYLFSLSDEAIILNGWNKRIVRDAMKDVLPRMVHRRRNKVGFTTPEVEWFKTLSDDFRKIFASKTFAARPYFNQKVVLDEFDAFVHDRSKADSMMFWRILNVELWLREFIDA